MKVEVKYPLWVVLFFYLSLWGCPHECEPWGLLSPQKEEAIVECLNGLAKEDILQIPQVRNFLENHPVYISLTTSPARLPFILSTLKSLDLEYITKIFLVMPKKYRNKEEYGEIPPEIKNFPKLEILRVQEDLGPVMKLLPAAQWLKERQDYDPESILITIDDDIGYPVGSVGQLIKYSILTQSEKAVIAHAGINIDRFNLTPQDWPTKEAIGLKNHRLPHKDIIEAYAGVAYKIRWIDLDFIKVLSQLSPACRTSDDIVISYVLAYHQQPRIIIFNSYYREVYCFDFGLQQDALHKGSGYPENRENSTVDTRYQKCVKDIAQWKKTSHS